MSLNIWAWTEYLTQVNPTAMWPTNDELQLVQHLTLQQAAST